MCLCCSVLQCVAVRRNVLQHVAVYVAVRVAVCCTVLQRVAACCSVYLIMIENPFSHDCTISSVALSCSVLQCHAVCVAVCCSALQCVPYQDRERLLA